MHLLDEQGLTSKGIRPTSRAQRWRLIEAGKFPKPIKIGTRKFWIEAEVDTWQAQRIAAAIAAREAETAK